MIEFEEILRENCKIAENLHEYSDEDVIWCMKEAIKQAIPIILKEVSEKACLHTIGRGLGAYEEVDKDSILSLEQELIQKLLKNE